MWCVWSQSRTHCLSPLLFPKAVWPLCAWFYFFDVFFFFFTHFICYFVCRFFFLFTNRFVSVRCFLSTALSMRTASAGDVASTISTYERAFWNSITRQDLAVSHQCSRSNDTVIRSSHYESGENQLDSSGIFLVLTCINTCVGDEIEYHSCFRPIRLT